MRIIIIWFRNSTSHPTASSNRLRDYTALFIDYIFSYYRSQKQTFGLVQSLLSNHSFQRCWRFRSQPLLHKLLGLWWHHSCTLTERWEVFFFRRNKMLHWPKKSSDECKCKYFKVHTACFGLMVYQIMINHAYHKMRAVGQGVPHPCMHKQLQRWSTCCARLRHAPTWVACSLFSVGAEDVLTSSKVMWVSLPSDPGLCLSTSLAVAGRAAAVTAAAANETGNVDAVESLFSSFS